jgi:hypothetical protein
MTLERFLKGYPFSVPIYIKSAGVRGHVVKFRARLMLMKAYPCRRVRSNIRAYRHYLATYAVKFGGGFRVRVSGKRFDNITITVIMPNDDMSPREVEALLERVFKSPHREIPVQIHVAGA